MTKPHGKNRHPTSKIGLGLNLKGNNVLIDEGAFIGQNVSLGANVHIYPNTIIGDNVSIGDNAVLGRKPKSGTTSIRQVEDIVAPLMIRPNVVIGSNVVIYAGCIIGQDAMIADMVAMRENCNICRGVRIGRGTTMECNVFVDENTVIQTACHITGDCHIGKNVFLGPECCTMNDKYMGRQDYEMKGPEIEDGASVGANATILPGIQIGAKAVVGAGSVVTHNVPASQVWIGNPARFLKEVQA